MSLSWKQRKARLATLVLSTGDEDVDGTAVDRLMHGQNAIGKTAKTAEIDSLRFQDKDLVVAGTLEHGQFGVIELVTCRHDNLVYVRKSTEKKFAIRTREQCSPQTERNILIAGTLSDSPWVPHLLATYQMSTHLHFVMEYAEGGNLWDVLESSPHDGKILESDLLWWTPQIVSAIHWCHSQGYAHRDIKPHNFVLTREARIQLVDFGSAAPLLPPGPDGSQRLPRKHCLVPCGTCDYISPEILEAHEEALVALEMEDEDDIVKEVKQDSEGYGVETDWWSMGAMLYELAYGVAPFFANEIRHTYQRILNHERSLRFESGISSMMQDFLKRLLTHAHKRLGRHGVMEITGHPLFEETNWSTLTVQEAPVDLHVPQYTYSEPQAPVEASAQVNEKEDSDSYSQGFAFSAFFQSSQGSQSRSLSIFHNSFTPVSIKASPRDDPSSAFIGFTWGPHIDAFPDQPLGNSIGDQQRTPKRGAPGTPSPFRVLSTPVPAFIRFSPGRSVLSTPLPAAHHQFTTPVRPWAVSQSPMDTIRRTSTLRRTATKREVSDREAMKQLVDCIGMSARKKVLESGRKPKILTTSNLSGKKKGYSSRSSRSRSGSGAYSSASLNASTSFRRVPSMKSLTEQSQQTPEQPRRASARGTGGTAKTTTTNGTGTLRKELRFYPTPTPVPNKAYRPPDYETTIEDNSGASMQHPSSRANNSRLPPLFLGRTGSTATIDTASTFDMDNKKEEGTVGVVNYQYYTSSECTDSEGPPSPSPSPRPNSVASNYKGGGSAVSRRSGTPTLTTISSLSAVSYRRRSASVSSVGMLSAPSPSITSGHRPWESDKDQGLGSGAGEAGGRKHDSERQGQNHEREGLVASGTTNNPKRTSPPEQATTLSDPRRPSSNQRRSDTPSAPWDDMEAKHERMMYDINQLEQRLKLISRSTGSWDGRGYTHRR